MLKKSNNNNNNAFHRVIYITELEDLAWVQWLQCIGLVAMATYDQSGHMSSSTGPTLWNHWTQSLPITQNPF